MFTIAERRTDTDLDVLSADEIIEMTSTPQGVPRANNLVPVKISKRRDCQDSDLDEINEYNLEKNQEEISEINSEVEFFAELNPLDQFTNASNNFGESSFPPPIWLAPKSTCERQQLEELSHIQSPPNLDIEEETTSGHWQWDPNEFVPDIETEQNEPEQPDSGHFDPYCDVSHQAKAELNKGPEENNHQNEDFDNESHNLVTTLFMHDTPHTERSSSNKNDTQYAFQIEKDKCRPKKTNNQFVMDLSDSDSTSDLDFSPIKITCKSRKPTSRKSKAKGPESNKSDDQSAVTARAHDCKTYVLPQVSLSALSKLEENKRKKVYSKNNTSKKKKEQSEIHRLSTKITLSNISDTELVALSADEIIEMTSTPQRVPRANNLKDKCRPKKTNNQWVIDLSDSDSTSDLDFSPIKITQSKKPTSRKPKAKGPESNKSDDQKYKLTKEKKKTKALTKEEAIGTALDRLHSYSVPDSLPCRESQFADIYNFVEQKLMNGEGGCMYISGVPGTGKTTTLYEVRRKLEQCEGLPPFKFIEINGVRLGNPKQFYPHLLMELTGEKMSISQALNALNERFTDGKPSKKLTVLLVDELDFLRTKTQNILYNVFDWPTKQNSRLIVLAITNTMDLPERFMLKFSSRIAFTRLSFNPYNFKELEQIVRTRLSDLGPSDVFEPDALQLICRKVAALSGDARRVLDICRRSAEITIADKRVLVTMRDVDKALQEIFNSCIISRIKLASMQEQIFLRALIQDFRISGLEEARFLDIYKSHVEICRLEGHYVPSTTELTKVATNLDLSKIILFQKSPSHLYRCVSLNISTDDIILALK